MSQKNGKKKPLSSLRKASRYRLPRARSPSITHTLILRQVTCHHLPAVST